MVNLVIPIVDSSVMLLLSPLYLYRSLMFSAELEDTKLLIILNQLQYPYFGISNQVNFSQVKFSPHMNFLSYQFFHGPQL